MQAIFALTALVNNTLTGLPLTGLSYTGVIDSGVAVVRMTQSYINTHEHAIDVVYSMPVLDNVMYDSFSASFGNTTLTGKVMSKSDGRQIFEQAVNDGYQAAMASASSSTVDIVKIEIGNIDAGQHVTLELTYITALMDVYDGNLEFKIPAALTPRYVPANYSTPNGHPNADMAFTTSKEYTWSIELDVNWNAKLKGVFSPSHKSDIQVTTLKNGSLNVKLDPKQQHYPNKDFRLVVQEADSYPLVTSVAQSSKTQGLPQFAAMMQFVPDFNADLSDSDLIKQRINSAQGEYIFLLDRSVSMMGERIVQAIESLKYFIKSLPENSYFNVISFGSYHNFLARESLPYNDETVSVALKEISNWDANFGGTEIHSPLEAAFSMAAVENYQRSIFLLTDGSVSNSGQIVDLIKKNTKNNQARVFSIGIGNGCSETFIRSSAEHGHGKSLLISDLEEDIEGKVINLLYESLSPAFSNFEIDFDRSQVLGMVPLLNTSSHILRNQPFRMYALLKTNKPTEIKVSFYDSVQKERRYLNFTVGGKAAQNSDKFHKLFLERVMADQPAYFPQVSSELTDKSQVFEELGVGYQVWSPKYTSFVCVSDHAVVDRDSVQKIIVPTIESVDYDHTDNRFMQRSMTYSRPSPSHMKRGMAYGRANVQERVYHSMQPDAMMTSMEMAAPPSYTDQAGGNTGAAYREIETASSQLMDDIEEVSLDSQATENKVISKPTPQIIAKKLLDLVSTKGTWTYTNILLKIDDSLTQTRINEITGQQTEDLAITLLVYSYLGIYLKSESKVLLVMEKSKQHILKAGIDLQIVATIQDTLAKLAK